MGCITAFIFIANLLLLIVADLALWSLSATMGLYGLCGIVAFIVAYRLSNGMDISPLDNFINSEFGVFIKRLTYANTSALVVWGGIVIVTTMLGWESSVEFWEWVKAMI